jgi:hypothetical protein
MNKVAEDGTHLAASTRLLLNLPLLRLPNVPYGALLLILFHLVLVFVLFQFPFPFLFPRGINPPIDEFSFRSRAWNRANFFCYHSREWTVFRDQQILLLRIAFNEGEATEGEAASTSTRNDDKPQIPVSLNQT